MNLMKTLTIGAAALGWLALAGQASAAPSGSSKEAKYAAATRYESGSRPAQKQKWSSSSHRSVTGRSAYAPHGMSARCAGQGGRLIVGRGGDWRCVTRSGRSIYVPKSGRSAHAPRGREMYHQRGIKGGRSLERPQGSNEMQPRATLAAMSGAAEGRSVQSPKSAPQSGAMGTHGRAPYSDIPSKPLSKGRSGAAPKQSR